VKLTSADEQKLVRAVDRIGYHVDADCHPTDALVKTAQELDLQPGFIRVAGSIYNSGAQVDQFQRGKTAADKLASMPLADIDKAIDHVYGEKPKSTPAARVKVASDAFAPLQLHVDPLPEVPAVFFQKAASDVEKPAERPFFGIMKKLAADRETVERLNVDIESSRETALLNMRKLANYFKMPQHSRLSLADVEAVCKHVHADFDMDGLFTDIGLEHTDKRASDHHVVTGRINLNSAPFTYVKELIADVDRVKTAIDQVEQAKIRILDFEKQAGLGDIGNIGIGTALGQSIMGKPSDGSQVQSLYDDLNDPNHTQDLNSIRSKAVLSHVINDPDDPIRDVPLHKIVQKTNDIAAVAPHIARMPGALKPLLRRALQSAPQPFELQEMSNLERTISPPREARKPNE